MREHLFLSHANPEDNEFTRWLALRLIAEGYRVWCDLIQLKGGEDFWEDIEEGIRTKTVKFCYVVSTASNHKAGPNKELHVAEQTARTNNFKDFIVPLRIDQLAYSDFNIRIASLNAIDFASSWATGLDELLVKLRRDGVCPSIEDGPNKAAAWWDRHNGAVDVVSSSPEECFSNWFPIVSLPQQIHFHELKRKDIGPLKPDLDTAQYPAYNHGLHVVSFADRASLEPTFQSQIHLGQTSSVLLHDFLDGYGPWGQRRRREATNILNHLLTDAWTREMLRRGLPAKAMANGRLASYFPKGIVGSSDRVSVPATGRPHGTRQLVGYRTVYGKQRYWHVALQARPSLYPERMLAITVHVLFSDDGRSIWTDTGRSHSARRSQCKDWWNAEWRDRLLGSMDWLGDAKGEMHVGLGPAEQMLVGTRPLTFLSPLSYSDVQADRDDDTFDDDDGSDDEHE